MKSAKKSRKKIKKWKKFIKRTIYPYIKWFCIVTAAIEAFNILCHVDILLIIKNHMEIGGPIALLTIIAGVIKLLFSCKADSTNSCTPDDSTIYDRATNKLRKIIDTAKQNGTICIIIVIVAVGSPSVYAAHEHMYGRLLGMVLDFGKKIVYYNDDAQEYDVQETDDYEQDDTVAIESNNIPSNLIDKEPSINADDTPAISESPIQFLADPNRHLVITESEESDLFFLMGKYAIDYTIGLESAVDSISNYISDLRLNSEESNFDDEAPPNVRRQIARASDLEIDMSTSNQLDEVIYIRQSVWDSGYRKYSIAWNSANNMQYYAQQYLAIEGNYDTIKYYYYRSIIWCWEALCFRESDKKSIKSTIKYIKMRYHDIMDLAPNGSTDKLRAEIIYKALDKIEDSM